MRKAEVIQMHENRYVYMGNKSWKQSSIDFKEYTNISFVMATRQNEMMMHILVQAKRF